MLSHIGLNEVVDLIKKIGTKLSKELVQKIAHCMAFSTDMVDIFLQLKSIHYTMEYVFKVDIKRHSIAKISYCKVLLGTANLHKIQPSLFADLFLSP